ncbi:MAG: baseplate J/gp47 family protein [Achromobacter sp.]|nr:baseplate J/gp47 family protein [Achromobacter sp.]
MAYGLTPDGFVRMRLPEIRQEIIEDLRARLRAAGINDAVETRPDSVIGLLIDTFAERAAALWEQMEGVYLSMYPGSAIGVSLDRSVAFTGVTRQPDQQARAYVVLYGSEGTAIPAGALVRHRVSQNLWALAGDAQIRRTAAADVWLRPLVTPASLYEIVVDGQAYSYTSGPTTNLPAILAGLVAALASTGLAVSSDGAAIRLRTDGRVARAFTWSPTLDLVRLGSPALAVSADPSEEAAAPGDLNGIVTAVDGWDAVENLQAGVPGRLAENDAALRARYPTGLFRLGAATLPSLAPNIRDQVPGVRALRVFQNTSDDVDAAGRPPHCIHVVVDGGLDDEVARAIFWTKGGGIDTHGATRVVVTDKQGARHPIQFDRPQRVFVWVWCAVTLLPPSEQAFPPDGFDAITASLAAAGDGFSIGDDVIRQRLFGAIYRTPGIATVDLRLAYSTDPTFVPRQADYTTSNIDILDSQVAVFDQSRIKVT